MLERMVNFVSSLITIMLFVVSLSPRTGAAGFAPSFPALGVEERLLALAIVELALLYTGRVFFRAVAGRDDADTVARIFAWIAAALVSAWATILNVRLFFGQVSTWARVLWGTAAFVVACIVTLAGD
jgi:hypothetical protein